MKFKKCLLYFLAIVCLLRSASALVMRANGPEPVIVQIKKSLRLSDDLDVRLNELASLRNQSGLHVVKWWAGRKFLVMFAFPSDCTQQHALAIIDQLEQCPAVEKVVAASAYNLEFKLVDFARSYGPGQTIPDVARRGLDSERFDHAAFIPPDETALAQLPHLHNRLIVHWKDEFIWRAEQTGFLQHMADFHRATGCRLVRELRESPTRLSHVLEFDDPDTLADKLRRYMNSGWVEYAQPEFLYQAAKAAPTPNDPVYNAPPGPQWSLPLINAPTAWGLTKGDPSVIIAVADTGAPVNAAPLFPSVTPHPDFKDASQNIWNIWSGQNINVPGEIHNFYDGNNDVTDNWNPYYHGTLVSSIIGGRGNNALGMSGIAWYVSLMILKVMGPCGNFAPGCPNPDPAVIQKAFSSSVSQAIYFASDKGAAAINCSFYGNYFDAGAGFQAYDPEVTTAIGEARNNGHGGMLIVAGAVNAGVTNDFNGIVNSPTSIPLDNVVAVGATDINDQVASYSNYGIYRVDLGAPGGSDGGNMILGLKPTFNGNSSDPANYNFAFGTSFAAPHVSGAVALVKSKYPWETYLGVRDRILMGVEHGSLHQFDTKFRTKGRLDLYRALQQRTLIRNISTRAFVGDGDHVLIGGFKIGGKTDDPTIGQPPTLRVCLRGLGPSLPVSAQKLANPKIELFGSSGKRIALNEDWQDDPAQAAALTAAGLAPVDMHEAAIIGDLNPDSYTVVVSASPGTSNGIGLVEIYELSGGASERSRLVNLSTRCFVGTGDNVAIAGTIVGGSVDNPALPDRRILMLGRGPSLTNSGIPDALQDPQIDLRNSGGGLIANNNTWTDIDGPYVLFYQSPRIFSGNALEEKLVEGGFFSCVTTDPCVYAAGITNESALWPTLRSGSYTATLSGVSGTTGVGLIEFYEY